ncbi:MAG: peptidylprolyl isomerase [bacterium]
MLDRIVAIVEDDIILQSDLDRIELGSETDALNDLIEQKLLFKKAQEWNIIPSKKQIDEYINNIKLQNNLQDDAALENYLTIQDMSLDDLRDHIRKDVTLLRVKQRIFAKSTPPSEDEVKEYYRTRWEGEKGGEKVRVAHILLDEKDKELAPKIINEYKNGVSFHKLVSLYSKDTLTISSGGDLGYLDIDKLVPQFKAAVAGRAPGDIIGPIKTSSGYHILKIVEHKPAGLSRDSEVWTHIEEILWEEKRTAYFRKWVEDLKKISYIKINVL